MMTHVVFTELDRSYMSDTMICPLCDGTVWHPIDLVDCVPINDDTFKASTKPHDLVTRPEDVRRIYICIGCGTQIASLDDLKKLQEVDRPTFEIVPHGMARIQRARPDLDPKKVKLLHHRGIIQLEADRYLVTDKWLSANELPKEAIILGDEYAGTS
jgi:hypothetical protein